MDASSNQQAKCLRVVVTSFFADGSSVVIDIPEPAEVKDESGIREVRYDLKRGLYSPLAEPVWYEFVMRVRPNPDIPMRVMSLPLTGMCAGHVCHRCADNGPEHAGDHSCRCGYKWAKASAEEDAGGRGT